METIEIPSNPVTAFEVLPWKRPKFGDDRPKWRPCFSSERSRSDFISTSSYQVVMSAESETEMEFDVLPAKVRDDIFSYVRPGNYYGPGSIATSPKDCKAAIDVLTFAKTRNPNIAMPSSMSPSVDGGISLYWEHGECQLFIEISAASPMEISYQFISSDGIFSVGSGTRESLVEKLSGIYPQ